ncbi:zinc-binding dehydrogenase [Umezawaea tangerina]|uniref:NADPH:quinone reductase-like Zn-dependent oxidoreductase n=1 Tax=Umezawaea tangerina TaxID=84725 RepID=A0A2T0TH44_9PSEU|nr:zinc-binding dehydrogenase [Umezawaea tangerina]PRY45032.1 NADPH:quinone reductase-like Zn-dependent oxidoreductase [Umezawaea tangerina]
MRAAEIRLPGVAPVVVDREVPRAGDGEVVVEVVAAPVTPLDVLCAGGKSYFGVPRTPYVPGVQGVGTVDGRLVWFPTSAGMEPGDGSMAGAAVARRSDLVELPDGVDPVLVAAAGLSAVAAHMAMTWRGELVAGEQVVVLGAGGVVGQAAVQLARLAGARRVVAAARSAEARTRAAAAGADAVVALDTSDHMELVGRFLAACDGAADLVLDPLFGVPAAAAAHTLRAGGRMVTLGASAGRTCPLDAAVLYGRSLRLLGYTNKELTGAQQGEAVGVVAGAVARGELVVAHEVVELGEVTGAWERQEAGVVRGRVVLVP